MKELHGLVKKQVDILMEEGYIKDCTRVIPNGVVQNNQKAYSVCFDTSEEQHKAYMRIFQPDTEETKPREIVETRSTIKYYNNETIIIDSAFESEKLLQFALDHNFNICYTDTTCTKALEDIAEIQSKGYHIEIKRKKNMTPDNQFELKPDIVIFAIKHPIIPVKEYNQKYVGEMDRASLCCDWDHICNTLYKCDDHDGAVEQLKNGLGWGPEVTETIQTALKHYKAYLYSCFPE